MAMAVTGVEILQECLNVFSGQSAILKAHYDVEGEPLVMNVEDEGIVYTCSIKTLVAREVGLHRITTNLLSASLTSRVGLSDPRLRVR